MAGESTKRIVCLANSRKFGGRCVAGKELLSDGGIGAWIRPITDQPNGEVPNWECQYEDGAQPAVLDVLDIPLTAHVPKDYQRENWALAPKPPWRKVGAVSFQDAAGCADRAGPLWPSGHNTYNGLNDHVPLEQALLESDSLRLIRVNNLALSVMAPGESFGNPARRVLGRFRHEGLDYRLWVTDVEWENEYLGGRNGDYFIGEALLTISLGEPFPNQHGEYNAFKLIAAIITPDGGPPWKAQLSLPS